jgi:SAM-dependent methyltransferase
MSKDKFFNIFSTAFNENTFVKCTFSKPSGLAPDGLKNIFLRPVIIKNQAKISATYRFQTRDEVKNYALDEIKTHFDQWLGMAFQNADLFGTTMEVNYKKDKKGEETLLTKKPTQEISVNKQHNREKNRLLQSNAPWLHLLGITNNKGEVLHNAQDKWRQINKFLEIVKPVIEQIKDKSEGIHIADMGSGKGYLTFALYDFLKNQLNLSVFITGIELRTELVDFCNKTAKTVGFEGLGFIAQNIEIYEPARLDLLIALHACDTATDLAISKGLHSQAQAIIVAPCCHKQIRREMNTQNELADILKHGILEERQAEIVTDGIRALLMESRGYKTQVFEFISTEHTPKNVMITAIQTKANADKQSKVLERVAALKLGFGIKEHFLEHLLATS